MQHPEDKTPSELLAHYQRHHYKPLKEPMPLEPDGINDYEDDEILGDIDGLFDLTSRIPTNQSLIAIVREDDRLHVLGHPYLVQLLQEIRALTEAGDFTPEQDDQADAA